MRVSRSKRLQTSSVQGVVTHQQVDDAEARGSAKRRTARPEPRAVESHGSRSRVEDIESQQAALASAEARLAKAKTALEDASLIAPSRASSQ